MEVGLVDILKACPPGTIIYGETLATYPFWRAMTNPTQLADLASECVLKQANHPWDSATILADYFRKAYDIGHRDGYIKQASVNEEGGS